MARYILGSVRRFTESHGRKSGVVVVKAILKWWLLWNFDQRLLELFESVAPNGGIPSLIYIIEDVR
jgi:hypothetical protein